MESSSALAKPETATHTALSHTQSTSLVKNFRFRFNRNINKGQLRLYVAALPNMMFECQFYLSILSI